MKGYVLMRIFHGYIGVVDRVLEIFGEFGGWSIFKRLGVFKGIWNSSNNFWSSNIADRVHIKIQGGPKNPIFRLNFSFSNF